MKKRKLMMTVMSLALVLVVAIGGTLAYLSDQSNQVVNTFNVGNGYEEEKNPDDPNHPHKGLWLDETKKTSDTNPTEHSDVDRTETGNAYTAMLPGDVVAKDPTFHLTEGSVDSYVFAYVTNADEAIDKGFLIADANSEPEVGASALSSKWTKVYGAEDSNLNGLYVWGTPKDAKILGGGESTDRLFGYVWYGSTVDNSKHDTNYTAQENAADKVLCNITVQGVAVQAQNADYSEALAEAMKVFGLGNSESEGA